MQNKNLGIIFSVFLLVVLGYAFIGIIADNIQPQTTLYTGTNLSYTTAVAGNGTVEILGKALVGDMLVLEDVAGTDWSVNFTTTVIDNQLYLVTTDDAVDNEQNGTAVLLTYTYQPREYIADGTSRILIGLIVLFVAIGLLLYIVVPIVGNMVKTTNRI
jgi:hypothetical protein